MLLLWCWVKKRAEKHTKLVRSAQVYSEQNIDIADPGYLMEMPGDPGNQGFTVTYHPDPGEYDPFAVDISGEGGTA